jgi:hypothetical protein
MKVGLHDVYMTYYTQTMFIIHWQLGMHLQDIRTKQTEANMSQPVATYLICPVPSSPNTTQSTLIKSNITLTYTNLIYPNILHHTPS